MKVALCIAGQPRNIELGYQYIYENVLATCTPDVFIHAWDYTGDVYNEGGHLASEPVPAHFDEVIRKKYSPIGWKVESQIAFDEKDYNDSPPPKVKPLFLLSQMYSIKQSALLKRAHEELTGIKYDLVIRMRFDWAIRSRIETYLFDKPVVYCPNDSMHFGGVNDQFALGPSNLMDNYCDLYDFIDEYYHRDHIPFCNELLLGHHFRKTNTAFILLPFSYGLIRHRNLTQWNSR